MNSRCKNNSEWVQTYNGNPFFFDDPDNEYSKIDIRDICTHLARIPRGLGGWSPSISIAEHSVAVSYIVEALGGDKTDQLYGLLHDAHEAYVGDMPAPLKNYLYNKLGFDMKAFESEVQERIEKALKLPPRGELTRETVRLADIYSLHAERNICARSNLSWPHIDHVEPPEDFNYLIIGESPSLAAANFKRRYLSLRDRGVV